MALKVKTGGKLFLIIAVLAAIYGVKWYLFDSKNAIVQDAAKESVLLSKIDLPNAPKNAESLMKAVAMPSDELSTLSVPEIRWQVWAWNSQMGLMFANGGARTTKGSLMDQNGVRVNMVRQDNCGTNQESLIKFATAYKNDKNTTEGINFVGIMLDGAPAFLQAINPQLEKLGPEYRAEIIGSCGRSLGEDKFMGLPEWKENPQSAKGALVAAVLRDGDWNIVVKWAFDNNIAINPDETTYDKEAINFVAAADYLDAAEKYITGYSEERKVVIGKKKIGTSQKVTVNGVATWTPGDVNIAEKKGGLVTILSTKDNPAQMPNAIVGIKKFNEDNRQLVAKMLTAIFQGGDQVKSYKEALTKAADISAKVYNEADGKYWLTYYNGLTKADVKGLVVDLGGSRSHNLGDNMNVFGITENGKSSESDASVVYNKFGQIASKLYPELMPTFPNSNDVFNTTYLEDVVKNNKGSIVSGDENKFDDNNIKETVSKRSWTIEFESGKASFTPEAKRELDELYADLTISSGLKVEVHGYTDNSGNPDANYELSRARANAIKTYLANRSAVNFPEGRVRTQAHGQDQPVADNSTVEGRAKNRRVEIVMGR